MRMALQKCHECNNSHSPPINAECPIWKGRTIVMTERVKLKPGELHGEQVKMAAAEGFVPVAEAARLTFFSKPTIYAWMREKKILSRRYRKYVYVHLEELKKFVGATAGKVDASAV